MPYLAVSATEKPEVEVTDQRFLRVIITPQMINRAKTKASELPQLRDSIRQGEGNFAGFLGEEVVLAAFPEAEEQNSFDHDVALLGKRLEVKTKDRTIRPTLTCAASVAAANTRQQADYYVFVSLFRKPNTDDFIEGYVCGFYERSAYKQDAVFLSRGDREGDNGFTVRQDCYNLSYAAIRRSYERLGIALEE